MCKKFENNLIQPEIFVKNTEDTKTPINKMSSTLLKSTDNDEAYGQYVTQRLNKIHNSFNKFTIKLKIDFIFYTNLI